MKALLARLGLSDWFVVLAGLAVVLALEFGKPDPIWGGHAPARVAVTAVRLDGCPTPIAPGYTPRLFTGGLHQVDMPGPDLQPEQQTAQAQFLAEAQYFSAFAAAPDGAYGYTTNYGNPAAARADALSLCQGYSAAACTLRTEVGPATLAEIAPCSETLSESQASAFTDFTRATGPRAFARAVNGAFGVGAGPNIDTAIAAALAECRAYAQKYLGESAHPCELVDAYRS